MTRQSGPVADAGVDVVVPLYNKERHVARALNSVQAQTYQDWQVVIVDDGSTDRGADVVRRYLSDSRFTLVQQANAGPGAARNAGIRLGSAPQVAFLDADDEWLPSHLESAIAALRSYPDCAATVTATVWGRDAESRTAEVMAQGIRSGPWRCPTTISPPALKDAVDFFRPSSTVVRRAVLDRLGGFYDRTRCTYAEDSYLWLRLLMHERIHRDVEPRVWMHDEASDLGPGRRSPYPVPPILECVTDVLAECPASHRGTLARFLDWYAIWVALRLANQGEGRRATQLLNDLAPHAADTAAVEALRRARRRARLWPVRRLRWKLGRLAEGFA